MLHTYNWKISSTANLRSVDRLDIKHIGCFTVGDNLAHEWSVTIKDGDSGVDLSGYAATAYILRPDGNTVPVKGSVSGNVAKVVFPNTCYVICGYHTCIMRLSKVGAESVTIAIIRYQLTNNTSDIYVDDGSTIPSIDDLLAQIAAMESATAAAIVAAQRPPIIGSNSNWWVWDSVSGGYVDTGKPSQGSGGGENGSGGTDGFSPIATVTKIGNIATISITDANGTTTASVKDGEDGEQGPKGDKGDPGPQGSKGDTGATGAAGADGYTPVKGTDYWTATDREQMVQDVLAAALPNGDEVSY